MLETKEATLPTNAEIEPKSVPQTDSSLQSLIQGLVQKIGHLEQQVAEQSHLQTRINELETRLTEQTALSQPSTEPKSEVAKPRTTSRRKLLKGLGYTAAGIAAASAAVLHQEKAHAASGDFLILGNSNTASDATYLSQVSSPPSGGTIMQLDWNPSGTSNAPAQDTLNVQSNTAKFGLAATSSQGVAAYFKGSDAQIMLVPGATTGPLSGTHNKGELYLDSAGDLWICKDNNNLSTSWVKANGGSGGSGTYVNLQSGTLTAQTGGLSVSNTGNNNGVEGRNTAASSGGYGVYGKSTSNHGIYGESSDFNSAAIYARNTANTATPSGGGCGVFGQSDAVNGNGVGVYGKITNSTNSYVPMGVVGDATVSSSGMGVYGMGGLFGVAGQTTVANSWAVYGVSSGNSGVGVYGKASSTANTSTYGVYGDASASNSGTGIYGTGGAYGGYFVSPNTALYASGSANSPAAVFVNTNTGNNSAADGATFSTSSTSNQAAAIRISNSSGPYGLRISAANNYGIYASSSTNIPVAYFTNTSTSGNVANGIVCDVSTTSVFAAAGRFTNLGGGYGVDAASFSGVGLRAQTQTASKEGLIVNTTQPSPTAAAVSVVNSSSVEKARINFDGTFTGLASPNFVKNPRFEFWRRFGTSKVLTASTLQYPADSWRTFCNGTTPTITVSRQTVTPGDIPDSEPKYCFQWAQTGAGTSATTTQLVQWLEDLKRFAGKNFACSFWARQTAGSLQNLGLTIQNYYGTGNANGTPSATTNPASQNFALTANWTRYTLTGTMTTASGKTFGSNDDSGVIVFFSFANNVVQTVQIADVQFEFGLAASSFKSKNSDEYLRECERFFQGSLGYNRNYTDNLGGIGGFNPILSSNANLTTHRVPIQMRTPVWNPLIGGSGTAGNGTGGGTLQVFNSSGTAGRIHNWTRANDSGGNVINTGVVSDNYLEILTTTNTGWTASDTLGFEWNWQREPV